jgi:hypothetical protein
MARPRIVVADDHDKTRAAITSLLASDFDVVSTSAMVRRLSRPLARYRTKARALFGMEDLSRAMAGIGYPAFESTDRRDSGRV